MSIPVYNGTGVRRRRRRMKALGPLVKLNFWKNIYEKYRSSVEK
jgi:hypothetical protein